MEGICFITDVHGLEYELTADFVFQDSHVYTIDHKTYLKHFPQPKREQLIIEGKKIVIPEMKENEFGYLVIDSIVTLDKFDSLSEGSAKIRPRRLVIYGIIAFLTGHVLLPSDVFSSRSYIIKPFKRGKQKKAKLKCQEHDCSSDLAKVLAAIDSYDLNKKTLVFSLFERWRKALHLEQESEESFVHLDEAILAYVHILEVLADEFSDSIKQKLKKENDEYLTQIQEMPGKHTKDKEKKEIKKLVNKIKENQVTLKTKILAMLNEFEIDDDKTVEIVTRFIEHRNAIAHGRPDIYQEKVVFPLPPFFSLVKDINKNIETIKFLAAKCLSSYLGIETWSLEFEMILEFEPTPLKRVKLFIKEQDYLKISSINFISNHSEGPVPYDFCLYYLQGKLTFDEVEKSLMNCILTSVCNEDSYKALFSVAVILSDSTKTEIAEKAIEIITTVHKNNWGYYSNKRDVLKEYEYHGKTLTWYKKWLSNF